MTGAKEFDLDALAGEIAEHTIKVGGKRFTMPGDLPVDALLQLQEFADSTDLDLANKPGQSRELMKRFFGVIFGDEQTKEILSLCGLKHLTALMEVVVDVYDLRPGGKVPGSSRASRRAGARSKATSNGSTRSTSSKRASAAKPSGARTSRV